MKLRIKELCKTKKITMQQIADTLNISRQALDESIKKNPSSKRVQEIADALGVTVFELIEPDSATYQSYDQEGNWRGVLKK